MAQAHIDEVGPVWDNDNCDKYFAQIRVIADASQKAVCWWIDCGDALSYNMIYNVSYGLYQSDQVVEDAYTACYDRNTDDSLSTLNLINFGLDYICRNVTPEYLENFSLTEYEYDYIMQTVYYACYGGDTIDYWISYVSDYGVPEDFDCSTELYYFV